MPPVTKHVIILVGVSGVGKSYYCDQWILKNPEYVCVPALLDIDETIENVMQHERVIMDYYLFKDYNANKLRSAVGCPVDIIVLFERPEIISRRQIFDKARSAHNNVSCWSSREFYLEKLGELLDVDSCTYIDGVYGEYSHDGFVSKMIEYWTPYSKEQIEDYIKYARTIEGYDFEYQHMDFPFGIRIGRDGYARNEETWAIIKDWIDWKGKDVLDLCCFHGYFSQQIAAAGAEVVACDVHRDALYSAAVFAKINNIRFKLRACNVNNKIPAGEYDVALLFNVFHHLKNQRWLLDTMRSFGTCLFEINTGDRALIEEYFEVVREAESPKDGRVILQCVPREVKEDDDGE